MWEDVGTSVLAQTLATLGDMPNHHAKGVGTHSHGPLGLHGLTSLAYSLLEGLHPCTSHAIKWVAAWAAS